MELKTFYPLNLAADWP